MGLEGKKTHTLTHIHLRLPTATTAVPKKAGREAAREGEREKRRSKIDEDRVSGEKKKRRETKQEKG